MTKPVAYLDADIILHRAVAFCDDEFDGEPMSDVKQGINMFDVLLTKWLKGFEWSDYHLVFSVGQNFRKGLYADYKGNRKGLYIKPVLAPLKEVLLGYDKVIFEEGIEADDLIGIRCSEDPKGTLAVSADKDFATIPCKLHIPASHGRKEGQDFEFSEDAANLNWLRQSMQGDTIDNYKGIPGIGAVKAAKFLPKEEPVEVLWAKTKAAFASKGLDEDQAILMARLARILRAGEYDFEKKEVQLWNPSILKTPQLSRSRA